MREEKVKILKMLEEGKIAAEDAERLLDAIGKTENKAGEVCKTGKILKIRVCELGSSRPKVNLNIPIGWSRFLMPFVESRIQDKLRERGIDLDMNKVKRGMDGANVGKILEVDSGGDKVEVCIE